MRVGILTPGFPGQTHAFIWNEAKSLETLGVKPELISTSPPAHHSARHTWQPAAFKETFYLTPPGIGPNLITLWHAMMAGPRVWGRLAAHALRHCDRNRKDVIDALLSLPASAALCALIKSRKIEHLHCHMLGRTAIITALASRASGIPFSHTLHANLSVFGGNQELKWRGAAFATIVAPHLAPQVQEAVGDIAPPITVAPMGIDHRFFTRLGSYVPPAAGSPLRIASCGRLHPAKGHSTSLLVVHAIKQAGLQVHFELLGADDTREQRHLADLQAQAQALGISHNVTFHGSSSQEEVRDCLQRAHFYLHSSLDESVGIAIVEAMAMSLPCLVAETPGTRNLIHNNVDGILFDQGDYATAAETIASLVSDPHQCHELGQRARDKAVANYSAERRAKTLFGLMLQRPSDTLRTPAPEP